MDEFRPVEERWGKGFGFDVREERGAGVLDPGVDRGSVALLCDLLEEWPKDCKEFNLLLGTWGTQALRGPGVLLGDDSNDPFGFESPASEDNLATASAGTLPGARPVRTIRTLR